jgi:hypothetical protein
MKSNQKALKIMPYMMMFLLFIGMTAYSQDVFEVKNINAQMSKGMQTCYTVDIPRADLKTVQQAWIKKTQESNKVKVKETGQELVLSGVVKPELTNDSISIYSLLIQKDTMISLSVFIEIDRIFFSPKEDKTDLASDKIDNSIKNYLRNFAVEQYRIVVSNELKDQQKVLKTMQDDLEDLVKDQENMEKENSSLENDIEEKEREVKELDQDIDAKRQDIVTHNTSMLTITGEVETKAAKEKQKELEKEKKDLEKNRSRAKDDISSYKSKIEKNKKAIEESITDQEAKKQEIILQQDVITAVQAELNGIK